MTTVKTWIFAQPQATGSNGWAGKALVAGLNVTSVDRMAAFYEDDAHLIAAAPDLLEGCKAALGAFERHDAIDWDSLRKTIERAEGKMSRAPK